jgi:hypothetical protein
MIESFSSSPLFLFGWWWLWLQAIGGTYPSRATHITIIRTDMAAMRKLSLQVTGCCLSILITIWTVLAPRLGPRGGGKVGVLLAQSNWYSETSTNHRTAIQFRNWHLRMYLNMPQQNAIAAQHTKRGFPNTDREVLKSKLSASPCLSVRSYTYSYTFAAGNLLPSKHLGHDVI